MRHLGLAEEQRAELDAVLAGADGTAGTAEPSAGDRRVRPEAVMLVEPHRTLPGAPVVAGAIEEVIRRFARLDAAVELAQPPGGVGKEIEPLGLLERSLHVGTGERSVVAALPVMAGPCGAGVLKAAHHAHPRPDAPSGASVGRTSPSPRHGSFDPTGDAVG